MLAEIGEGGFGAQDLELTQQLGALSWVCAQACDHDTHLACMSCIAIVSLGLAYLAVLPGSGSCLVGRQPLTY